MSSESVALVSKMLALRAGKSPDADALAAAARTAFGDVERVAVSLIGPAGVDALAGRALHLAQREHPCLKPLPSQPDQPSEPFVQVVACLQQQDPAVATAAAGALFAILIDLLVTFIGKRLTTRLLLQAWPDVFVDARIEEP